MTHGSAICRGLAFNSPCLARASPPSCWRSISCYGNSWLPDTWEPHLLPLGTQALWTTQVRVVGAVGERATTQPTRAPHFHWGRYVQVPSTAAIALHISKAPGRQAAHHPILSHRLGLSLLNLPYKILLGWQKREAEREGPYRHYSFPLPTDPSLFGSFSL